IPSSEDSGLSWASHARLPKGHDLCYLPPHAYTDLRPKRRSSPHTLAGRMPASSQLHLEYLEQAAGAHAPVATAPIISITPQQPWRKGPSHLPHRPYTTAALPNSPATHSAISIV